MDRDLPRCLSEVNGFTESELGMNRQYLIARSQVARLYALALKPFQASLYTLLGWLIFLFVVKTLCPLQLFVMIEAAIGMSLFVLFAFITVGVLLAFVRDLFTSVGTITELVPDIIQGKAVCFEGRVSTSVVTEKGKGMAELHGENVDYYSYAIGNEYLPVTKEAYDALRPYTGSVFRVYLTPRSRLLLSIEPIKVRRSRS
jgi:hypothetical protein